jgi:hypothetical protein
MTTDLPPTPTDLSPAYRSAYTAVSEAVTPTDVAAVLAEAACSIVVIHEQLAGQRETLDRTVEALQHQRAVTARLWDQLSIGLAESEEQADTIRDLLTDEADLIADRDALAATLRIVAAQYHSTVCQQPGFSACVNPTCWGVRAVLEGGGA